MTNMDIITTAMVLNELNPMEVTVDTYAGWKRKGYCVKRGEKAVFSTKIWKPTKFPTDVIDEATGEIIINSKLILVPASFFTMTQVEKVVAKS